MMDAIFFIKFIVAVFSVVGLSVIFEKINPKMAGVLSGYPIATAIALFFFGFENGADFASNSAIFNIVGNATFLVFIYVYYRASRFFNKNVIIASAISAIIGYLVVAYVLQPIDFNLFSALLLSTLAIVFFIWLFRNIRDIQTGNKIKLTAASLFSRGVFSGAVIVAVTSMANVIGPEWAGLLSAFPSTTLPLMLIVHYKYTTLHLHALIKHIPTGAFSLLLYSSAVFYAYPIFGIYLGTVIAYAIATIFIIFVYFVQSKRFIFKCGKILGMVDKSRIHFIMTGGTIDSHYDRRGDSVVPNKESVIPEFIKSLEYIKADFTEICIKDSRDLTKNDFKKVLETVEKSPYGRIVITIGTYRLDKMAKYLEENLKRNDQTVVLTGSSTPLIGFSPSEGPLNLGHALACAQTFTHGIYISFNGEILSQKEIAQIIKEGGLAVMHHVFPEVPVY